MRRMLDPKEVGGSLPSTIKFDAEGNRTVGKNLGVDGKLKLKSLVSATNPDGDITKELGGGAKITDVNEVRGEISFKYNKTSYTSAQKFLYRHFVKLTKKGGSFVCFNVLHSDNYAITSLSSAARAIGNSMVLAIGSVDGSQIVSVATISGSLTGYTPEGTSITLEGYTITDKVGIQGVY